jgi:hypothetical protein
LQKTSKSLPRQFCAEGKLHCQQLYLSPGLANIAPWWLARRDNFSAKVPGLVTAGCATKPGNSTWWISEKECKDTTRRDYKCRKIKKRVLL